MQLSRRAWVGVAAILLIGVVGWWLWPRPQAQAAVATQRSQPRPGDIAPGQPGAAVAPPGSSARNQVAYRPEQPGSPASPAAAPVQIAYAPAAFSGPSGGSAPRNWAPGGTRPLNPALAPPPEVAPWKSKTGKAPLLRGRKPEDRKKHITAAARQKRLDRLRNKMSGRRLKDFDKRAEMLAKIKDKKKQ